MPETCNTNTISFTKSLLHENMQEIIELLSNKLPLQQPTLNTLTRASYTQNHLQSEKQRNGQEQASKLPVTVS